MAGNAASFATLPVPLLHEIFLCLPVDQRLLLSAVSRGLRATFSATVLWQNVDLSRGSGVRAARKSTLLRAITAKAAGTMVSLRVTDVFNENDWPFFKAVREAVRANSASLRRLSVFGCEDVSPVFSLDMALGIGLVEGLLADAPRLDFLETDVWSTNASNARLVLRNESPYGVLRARRVYVGGVWASVERNFAVRAVSDAEQGASWLMRVLAGTPGASHEPRGGCGEAGSMSARDVEALVDALCLLPRAGLCMFSCDTGPNVAPSIVRLLRHNNLKRLELWHERVFSAASVATVAQALRDAHALSVLAIVHCTVTDQPEDFDPIGDALVGHPSISVLTLGCNGPMGTLAGRLVAASVCPLATLSLVCPLSAAAELRPLCAALPSNTRLTELKLTLDGQPPAAEMLAAVALNTSLRALKLEWHAVPGCPALAQAMALVAARAAAQ